MPTIETPRLLLRPLPLEVAEALVHGHRPPGARWAPDYPTDGTLVAASIVLTAQAEGRPLEPWGSYQVVVRGTGVAVGGCGFLFGPPDARGHVQVSFSIVESEQGHGYGGEALGALVDWARRQPGVTRVLAETAATNTEYVRAYEQAGLRRAGADGGLVFFEA